MLKELDIFVRSHLSPLKPEQVALMRARWEREKRKQKEGRAAALFRDLPAAEEPGVEPPLAAASAAPAAPLPAQHAAAFVAPRPVIPTPVRPKPVASATPGGAVPAPPRPVASAAPGAIPLE